MVLDVRSTTVAVLQKGHSGLASLAPRELVEDEAPEPVAIFNRPLLAFSCRRCQPAAAFIVETGKESATVNGRVRADSYVVQPYQVRGRPNCGSGAPDVQNKNFSLLNRLQPVHDVQWPNFTKPECLGCPPDNFPYLKSFPLIFLFI